MRRIVGTAGHIDHGKTSLVRALTGIDTDRLPEEKRRGITIDLGFASWIDGDLQVGFIDVPGHERFVRNMLAGVGGIDAALLVVAADESIKPQTREHLAICRLLRIPTGVVALTKADLVEREILDLVRLEIEELVRGSFLEGKPVIATSAATSAGVSELKEALRRELSGAAPKPVEGRVFRLPIDRAFTMRGFGSVVTGTTVSGAIGEGEELEVLPERIRTRARHIQVHGTPRERASAGERTSINLADVPLEALRRGQHLVPPFTLRPSSVVTVELELLGDAPVLEDQTRIRFHHFSAELLGKVRLIGRTADRVRPGSRAWAQIRLEAPVVAVAGDRFVIRRYSPAATIGGGVILDPHLPKLARGTREEMLELLRGGSAAERVTLLARLAGVEGISLTELQARSGSTIAALERQLDPVPPGLLDLGRGAGRRLIHEDAVRDVRRRAMEVIEAFFRENRTALGMPKGAFLQRLGLARIDAATTAVLLEELAREGIAAIEGDRVHVPGRSRELGGAEGDLARMIEARFRDAGLAPPSLSELRRSIPQRPKTIEGVVGYLARSGVLVRLAENVYLHRDVIESAKAKLASHRERTVDVAFFKDLYGISRKIVIPLLEHFDRAGITKRVGDHRRIV
ncbi:MAG TPA: selenocysteine-specific translation elongation factor [Thermoanaerobaculia bacterium]|nr:selenocysteine-specific translation elongation factor [Thermoanaerobaculia bacterium]